VLQDAFDTQRSQGYLNLMPKPLAPPRPQRAVSGEEALVAESVVVTRLDRAIGWARKYSIFPYPFATACCAMEFMSLSMSPYDIDRFGALLPRFTPRQADLLMVIGTVTVRQAPILKRVFEQMGDPKWVMAFGACASSGGFYDNYTTLPGIDRVIPVDVYVPGCPPRPEAVLDGLMALQRKIQREKQALRTTDPLIAAS
jgi:NADH-quinone oxidoreductase subunit B